MLENTSTEIDAYLVSPIEYTSAMKNVTMPVVWRFLSMARGSLFVSFDLGVHSKSSTTNYDK